MNRPTRPSLLLALALACAPSEQTSATAKTTPAIDAADSDSTTGTSTSPTSGGVITTNPMPTSGDSTGACGPQLYPDMGPATCDLFLQDCPEGQKCATSSTASDNHICVPLDPNPVPPGAPCTVDDPVLGRDSCEKGSMCWNVSQDTGMGTCVSDCIGSVDAPTCADPTKICNISDDAAFELCLPRCDPLDPNACPDELCLPNEQGEAGFRCILDASGGGGVVDAPCAFANACNPGLICVNVALGEMCDQNAQGCCQPYCDLSKGMQPDPNPVCDTQGGQFCLPLFDPGMAPPGSENIGVCGIPQ